jgi:vitamin B12 transporter
MSFLLLLVCALESHAAEPTEVAPAAASVVVVFVDESGAEWSALGGLAVTLRNGVDERPLSSVGGAFSAEGVPAGPWRLMVHGRLYLPIDRVVDVPPSGILRLRPVLVANPDGMETLAVVGYDEAARMERSAQAVTVVETEEAQRQSADLGEVLARTQGVSVRRSGGLGSDTRFALNGLTDDQVRFFLDDVPLDLAGFTSGISNVPVDLVERVEVYRGVVPVRVGADALGGAVNLVSEAPATPIGGSVAYEAGSFHTHRLAASAHGVHAGTGLYARATGYFDTTLNDYPIEVEVPDDVGRLSAATVTRFHDGYRAGGGTLTLGVRERSWAEAFELRGFGSSLEREIQHNVVMTVPYGEPVYTIQTGGGTARWAQAFGAFRLSLLGGYTRTEVAYQDLGTCVYDWYGECVRDRTQPGEIGSPGTDQVVWDQAVVGRLIAGWRPSAHHGLTVSVAPTLFTRTGEDLLDDGDGRDPLTSQRDTTAVVSGVEYQLDALDERLSAIVFGKSYAQLVASEEPVPGGDFRDVDRTTVRFGVGGSARLHLTPWAYAKASYEYATRLPTPEEIFGDAVLTLDNLELVPEESHNVNVGVTLEGDTKIGELAFDANGFLREASDLIVLLGNDRTFAYFNVYGARSVGADVAAGWTSPGDWVSLDVNGSWIDLRNTSAEGTFGDFAGDRIPNRPWLLGNAAASVGASRVSLKGDRVSLDWYTRYVREFYRGWESVGLAAYKQSVPDQLSHTAALTYVVPLKDTRLSASLEVQNLTDARLYDVFGIQRPGRAVFGKVTIAH